MKLLGEHFDIHGGGLDLVFPHHENEVVQSESYSGKPFATYWLHNGLLTKAGKKISKSDPGTVILMNDLLRDHDPDTLRCLFLSSHYRPADRLRARPARRAGPGPGGVLEPVRPLRAAGRRELLRPGEAPDLEPSPTYGTLPVLRVRRAPGPVPGGDGRRLQHRRGLGRALRAGPGPEPVRRLAQARQTGSATTTGCSWPSGPAWSSSRS